MGIIAALQMTASASVEKNLAELKLHLMTAKEQGVDLLVLPENFALMGQHEQDKLKIAEEEGQGPIQEALRAWAKAFDLWLVAGTIPLKASEGRVKSSCLVFDNQGECRARYDKIHLFDVCIEAQESYQESALIERGDAVVVVDTPLGKLGLSICYDLRFPELFRQLALKGAEIFTLPSAFTVRTGRAHWEVLLRARAIENLCYLVAANEAGLHENGRETYGHSMIIDPWGKILVQEDNKKGIIKAKIDLKILHQYREQFPCHAHHVLT